MMEQIRIYFENNLSNYLSAVGQHLLLSLESVLLAILIGLPLGYLAYRSPKLSQVVTGLTQGLRVIPSLGVLFILIPFIGVGHFPALIALTLLGIPPVLLNAKVGFSDVSESLLETGRGLGMTEWQLFYQVHLPLALPHLLNGVKLALVEIIASATLATYIGAGGLGEIIFTGLGLYRYDLLMIGGVSVALLSFISMISFDLLIRGVERNEK